MCMLEAHHYTACIMMKNSMTIRKGIATSLTNRSNDSGPKTGTCDRELDLEAA